MMDKGSLMACLIRLFTAFLGSLNFRLVVVSWFSTPACFTRNFNSLLCLVLDEVKCCWLKFTWFSRFFRFRLVRKFLKKENFPYESSIRKIASCLWHKWMRTTFKHKLLEKPFLCLSRRRTAIVEEFSEFAILWNCKSATTFSI